MTKIIIGQNGLYYLLRRIHAYEFANIIGNNMKLKSCFSFLINKQKTTQAKNEIEELNIINKNGDVISKDIMLLKKVTGKRYKMIYVAQYFVDDYTIYDYIFFNKYGSVAVKFNKITKQYKIKLANQAEVSELLSEVLVCPINYSVNKNSIKLIIKNKILNKCIEFIQDEDMEEFINYCDKMNIESKSVSVFINKMFNNDSNVILIVRDSKNPFNENTCRLIKAKNNYYFVGNKKYNDKWSVLLYDSFDEIVKEILNL